MEKQLNSNELLEKYQSKIHWIVLALAILIYANTLNHQMALDDYSVIVTHTHVQNGIDGIGEIMSTNYRNGNGGFNDGLYRPLSLVTFALEKEFFNSDTRIAHAINVLLYALACLFLFLSLRLVFEDKPLIIPLLITCLFIAHPLHTEVVANIKGRDEILAFFGLSLALYFQLKAMESKKIKHVLLAVIFFILALFSKESAVTYALLIPAIIYLKKGVNLKQLLPQLMIYLPLIIGFMLLRSSIVSSMPTAVDPGNFGLLNNPIAASEDANLKYGGIFSLQSLFLYKLFLPIDLIHDYSFNQIPLVKIASPTSLLGLLILIGMMIMAVMGLLKKNKWGILAAIYLICIVVVSQFLVTIGIQFAERMLFLAALPFSIFLVYLMEKLLVKNQLGPKQQKNILIAGIAITALFAFKSIDRNKAWQNNLSLYQTDIESGNNSARINYNIGTELNQQSQLTAIQAQRTNYLNQAIQYLNRAIQIYPEYLDAYNNLGLAYKYAGNYESAAQVYLKGIQIDPNYSKNYFNLGTVYFTNKEYRKAIKALQGYVNLKNNAYDAYFIMGQSAGNLGQFEEAIGYLNICINLNGNHTDAHNYLGMAYGTIGDNNSAIASFNRAHQLAPKRTDILINLAVNYRNQGNLSAELSVLQKVIQLDPNNALASSRIQEIQGG